MTDVRLPGRISEGGPSATLMRLEQEQAHVLKPTLDALRERLCLTGGHLIEGAARKLSHVEAFLCVSGRPIRLVRRTMVVRYAPPLVDIQPTHHSLLLSKHPADRLARCHADPKSTYVALQFGCQPG